MAKIEDQNTDKKPYKMVEINKLRPYRNNSRTHGRPQTDKLAACIKEFGFINPIICTTDYTVVAGHGRLKAAEQLKLTVVPAIFIDDLTDKQIRAYRIADNKLAELSAWDHALLKIELKEILADTDPINLGFEPIEIDTLLHGDAPDFDQQTKPPPEPETDKPPVTSPGDIWVLGEHRLLCGNALDTSDYRAVMGDDKACIVITDPPYNVPVRGHISGLGKNQHREFSMASGEMSGTEFEEFLRCTFRNLTSFSQDGSIHYLFMDWRHTSELLNAAKTTYQEQKNLIVWTKTNGGMGSFYRSQHELIFVFKSGNGPHINNFGLGTQRYRTNVWNYPGANSFGRNRNQNLADHPTVKPVQMIADALMDCSATNSIVLDPFCGSGTTLLAAELTGRSARCIELDAHYCDVAVRRWQAHTGNKAYLRQSGRSFDHVCAEKSSGPLRRSRPLNTRKEREHA